MASPVRSSQAIIPYTPPSDLSIQNKDLMEKMRDIYMRHSLHTQMAECNLLQPIPLSGLIAAGAYPRPLFQNYLPEPFTGTGEELLDLIEGTVYQMIGILDYNGLRPYLKMIDQLEAGVPLKDIVINSCDEAPSSTCSGMSWALLKAIKERHGIEGMFAAQRIRGEHAFTHAAVIIECLDGYVRIDPNASNAMMVVIPFEDVLDHGDDIRFRGYLPGASIPVAYTYLENNLNYEILEYGVNIANADDLVMKHFMMTTNKFSITAYGPDGIWSQIIWVLLKESKLVLKNSNFLETDPRRTTEISFSEVQEGHLHPKLQELYDSPVPTFHLPCDVLHEQLVKFVSKADLIRDVRLGYRDR